MDNARALKIAIDAIDKEIQRLTSGKNPYDKSKANYPQRVKERELKLAKAILIQFILSGGQSTEPPEVEGHQLTLGTTENGSR